jgi:ketosteroid isomerase-like protein
MGSEALELTMRGYEAWNRGDERWFVDRLADEFVLRFPPGFFVLDEVYRGVEGWRKFWRDWRGAWADIVIEIGRIDRVGPGDVLAVVTFEGVGRESGAPVTGTVAHRFKWAGERLLALTVTPPGEGLEAAGLRG